MLAPENRLRRSVEFGTAVRRGRRATRGVLTVHLLLPAGNELDGHVPARAGLVVSKTVGGSVVRSRVSRRLRHLLRPRVGQLPEGASLVVRAAPGAATASSDVLAGDLDRALAAVQTPRGDRATRR